MEYGLSNINSYSLPFCSGCGGYLHANRGVVTSPNYGQIYPPNLNCSWHVLVTPGFIIGVHFEEPFQVLSEDASCSHGDYVEVRQQWLDKELSLLLRKRLKQYRMVFSWIPFLRRGLQTL